MQRRVSVSSVIFAVDHETFGSNETKTEQQDRSAVVGEDAPADLMYMETRVGGELRIELRLIAQALPNGNVRIRGNVKLYEGTSETSNDLDGEKAFSTLVPANAYSSKDVTITNQDEGGDYANISMHFGNFGA